MNNLNGIAERFGEKESFEHIQLYHICYLDYSLLYPSWSFHSN